MDFRQEGATAAPLKAAHRIGPPRHLTSSDRVSAQRLLHEIAAEPGMLGPASPRQPLVLYGGGDLGLLAREHLRTVGCDIAIVVDRNAAALSAGTAWRGIPVLAPDDVPATLKNEALLAVSIVTSPYSALEAALRADGWRDILPFYDLAESFRDRHPLSNGWFAAPFEPGELQLVADVLDGWEDDRSRAHHLQFIAWRRLRQEWMFSDAPVTIRDRFFIPEIVHCLTDSEFFVDGGAHHGSVSARFLSESRERLSGIVAIEPDAANRGVLADYLGGLPSETRSRIAVSDALLDKECSNRRFHEGLGYASQLSETGNSLATTTTLDSLDLSPTFIKLHLEGAELAALQGGAQTIVRHRPILALTTYHNPDGIWRTPAWLTENLEDYRFLMRLHGWCGTGAVVYAIPKERWRNS
ncbi:FkbM family methyltransferase [Rhizobium sp. BK251]|uniref:FkbM family methyltransferase n=1 Tax=Rhizobium sp. BK251 TaxID=2512125 RepID=UPI001051A3FB|nr:FkbM family methyltransferase [Rhizobium sp. BK251]TCL75625.1 FkbM family methyltransferase [Rhizobium sp. BK251]